MKNVNEEAFLYVESDRENYEYDIHSLVKAFYPEKQVKVASGEKLQAGGFSPDMRIHIGEGEASFENLDAENYVLYRMNDDGACTQADDGAQTPEKRFKNAFKRFLYQALSEITGKELPWGNLTGIRPTKIAMELLESGKGDEEIVDFMKTEHFVSDKKAALSLDIAKREKRILDELHYENGYSLYIGIPFCPTTCLYCSFTSYPVCVWEKRMDEYLDCLIKEIDYVAEAFRDKVLDTIYIGGGTPTSLSAERLERLLSKLESTFDVTALKEFTVEAGRADSITREKLEVIKKHHVTRISVNPQTMKDETLKLIGRQHNVTQVVEAFHMAREVGFDNINMDLILGLPGENAQDVEATIEAVKELEPDNLTVHSLAVKRASRLNQWIEENGISTLRNTDETMEIAAAGAEAMGMKPYYLYRQKNMSGNFENTGYAKEGKNGIYNILIMEEKQTIVALGAGSITKRVFADGRIERCDNVKDVAQYMERIDEMIERKKALFALDITH